MAVLDLASKNNKTTFATGAFGAGQMLVACDVQAVSRHLQTAPYDLSGAARRSQHQYRFPAQLAGGPLLIDEGLRLPVSLGTALQTAAMYQGLNWSEPVTRRYIAGEFFRQYTEMLLKETVGLAVVRQVGLNLAATNLVIGLLRGAPTGLQLRRLGGAVGPAFAQPAEGSNFEAASTTLDFYAQFFNGLLEHNLRPLVAKLVEASQVKPDVLWDYAIEAMLSALDNLALTEPILAQARTALMIEELHPGDRLVPSSGPATLTPGALLLGGGTIYLKRKCCEKFKKKDRCSNCPGNRKR